jgi:hypothetical protein
MLEPNMAQMVAIFLHELVTNAAKYGSLSAPSGHLEIAWSGTADGRLNLRWTESGGPTIAPPTQCGFGAPILKRIVGDQLGGQVVLIGAILVNGHSGIRRIVVFFPGVPASVAGANDRGSRKLNGILSIGDQTANSVDDETANG